MPRAGTPKIPLGPTNNPGGARWCEEHERLECMKHKRRDGSQCHARAVRGTDACMTHSGKRKALHKLQGQARITAWNPHGKADNPISAPMAVLGVLQMSWLRLAAISDLLRQQIAKEQELIDNPQLTDDPSTSGFIGYRYGAAGKDGIVYIQSEEIRALALLEAAERDRVVKYAKAAHDMGISARMTDMAEKWGDLVATRISVMLNELGLSPEQAVKVPSMIMKHLSSIDMDALGAGDGTTGK